MKFRITTFMIIIAILALSSSNFVNGVDHNIEHAHEGISIHTSSEQCDAPTYSLTIIGGENEEFKFDKAEYKVPKDTCVDLTFQNVDFFVDHDMNIDEVAGENGFKVTHLHQANATDGPDGDGTIGLNIQTPNADTEFEIYCSVEGHREAGMVAKLVVGDGKSDDSSLPGFGIFGAIFSFAFITFFLTKRKKS